MSGIPAGAGSLLGKRLGKYEILALLALGGTAEIYLARIGGTNGFEKYVVVKCLHDHLADDQDFVKMFLDEARIAAQLDHSNVVQTFELGEHENRYYMVLEFLAGLSLAMVVRRAAERLPGGRIPIPLILNIAAQACAGLHYAHERVSNGKPLNIVHRDISPQNLVLSFEGVVKVVDFGIARAEMRETKTKAGTIKGKFAYMSPEQCVAHNVDRRTDVFALGVIVWELLTGKRLFKRSSPYETYQAVVECNVPALSSINHEVDPEVEKIVGKAVAKDKEQRYATAEAFGDALQGYLHHRGKGSGPGEVGRFFDQYFSQEIEEHGERMRELISGRDLSVDTGVNWGGDEEKPNETVDLSATKLNTNKKSGKADQAMHDSASIELTGGDLLSVNTGEQSLDRVIDDIEPATEDSIPVDRTRIEANPLEKVRQLDAAAAPSLGSVSGVAPLPAPPAAPRPAILGAGQSGRFPELANLPTQLANEGRQISEARTELGKRGPINPNDPRLQVQPPIIPSNEPVVARAGPTSATHEAAQAYVTPYPQLSASPYPVVSGRPFSTDLAPSNLPPVQPSPFAGMASDPHHAASLVSPVGDRFPQMDWAAAAAQPAKALPRWIFAALFVGAVLGALLITVIIAKIIR